MLDAASDVPTRLRAAGLRVTSQRLLLHAALVEMGRHATAGEVMRAAVPRLPGLSLPTVYATLELFARLGLVQRVAPGGGAVRWDPGPEPHAHFSCTACGALEDVPGAADAGALSGTPRVPTVTTQDRTRAPRRCARGRITLTESADPPWT